MHSSKVMAAFENSMLEIIAAAVDDYKTLPFNSCHQEPAIDTKDELGQCKDQLMDQEWAVKRQVCNKVAGHTTKEEAIDITDAGNKLKTQLTFIKLMFNSNIKHQS